MHAVYSDLVLVNFNHIFQADFTRNYPGFNDASQKEGDHMNQVNTDIILTTQRRVYSMAHTIPLLSTDNFNSRAFLSW